MYLIRVGARLLNLEYFIMSEDGGGDSPLPPGVTRVTMESGKEFDLVGPDADAFRAAAGRAVEGSAAGRAVEGSAPGPSPGDATMSVRMGGGRDGRDGSRRPPTARERKKRG